MLRYLGIFLMLIDHITLLYFPDFLLGRIIGRLCAPIFFYYLSEGYKHTSNLKNYLERLVKWALLSQVIIWTFFDFEQLPSLNILFTLAWCLISLHIFKLLQDRLVKILFLITTCFLASYFNFVYGWYAVSSVFIFYYSEKYLEFRSLYVLLNVISMFDVTLGLVQFFASPAYYLINRFRHLNWSLVTKYKINWYAFYTFHWVLLCMFY
jgi:hypothetical protein